MLVKDSPRGDRLKLTDLILVFGVTGVGKTTACRNLACRANNVAHLTASELLNLKQDTAGGRTLDQVLQDQYRLVELVRVYRDLSDADIVLLDGHNYLSVQETAVPVPIEVVSALRPKGIIFLEAPAGEILRRRLSRNADAKCAGSVESIEQHQQRSLQLAQDYAHHLCCKLVIERRYWNFDLRVAVQQIY